MALLGAMSYIMIADITHYPVYCIAITAVIIVFNTRPLLVFAKQLLKSLKHRKKGTN